jgi:ABC-2 type transport system permease protein
LKTVLALIRKDYRLFFADRVAVGLTFVVPIILIALWGSIFGNVDEGPRSLRLAFVNQSTAPIAARIERVLDTTKTFRLVKSLTDEQGRVIPFDSVSVKDFVRRGAAPAALVIPPDASTDTSFGLKLKFYYDPRNDMEMQIIQGVLQQTIMSQLPEVFLQSAQRSALRTLGADSGLAFNRGIADLVSTYFGINPKEILSFQLNDTSSAIAGARGTGQFFSNVLRLEKEQLVGRDVANPWATRSVGGWAIMFLLFSLSASATSLFDEKQNGVVLRLLAAPVSRVHILWSKYLFNMSIGCLQLAVLFIAGALLFRIDILSNVLNLALVLLAASTACTAFGMLLAAFSKTQGQARGLGTLFILAMSSIGGAWFPTSFMPPFIQLMGKASLVYWSMEGFLQVLWRNAGTVELLPVLGVLFGMSALITTVSVWQFRKGHVF